jgi:hypothetical protein
MAKRPVVGLPDLDDDDAAFRAKLRPLAHAVLPQPELPEVRTSDHPDIRTSGVEAARKIEAVYQARGPRRRFEYLLPERVGQAVAEDAESRGLSAAQRLLEVLRDAGYPVIPEDFTDIRKMRRT